MPAVLAFIDGHPRRLHLGLLDESAKSVQRIDTAEKLAMRYPAGLKFLPTAVGMLTAGIGVAARFSRRDRAFVDLPAGAAAALRQYSLVGAVGLPTLAAPLRG